MKNIYEKYDLILFIKNIIKCNKFNQIQFILIKIGEIHENQSKLQKIRMK
jgi:hypothetical protein